MSKLVPSIADSRVDTLPVERATLDDLNLVAVAAHIERAVADSRYDGSASAPLAFLHEMRCVVSLNGQVVPTMAGLLVFGHRPQAFLEHTDIALAQFAGTRADLVTETLHFKRYGGPLPQQIDEVEKYLWSQTRRGISTGSGAQRDERPEYPRKALRELTTNAVVHRDYNLIGSRTQIAMFTDRLEWRSPGGLPDGMTEESIFTSGSRARNPTIAQLLYQARYIEAYGMGLPTVVREIQQYDLPPLGLRDTGSSLVVILRGPDAPNVFALGAARRALLDFARKHHQFTLEQAIATSPDRARRTVQADLKFLIDQHFLRAVGQSHQRVYMLAEEADY